MIREQTVQLSCHPATRTAFVRDIDVRVRRSSSGDLELGYRLSGNMNGIRVPPPAPPRFGAELWRHTCFEAFVALGERPGYHEFNFAPSGAWATYAFDGYRSRSPRADHVDPPTIRVRTTSDGLALDARVRLGALSPEHAHAPLRVGISVVIEATDDALSYWALHHPANRPDFHHADAFVLRLEAPRS